MHGHNEPAAQAVSHVHMQSYVQGGVTSEANTSEAVTRG